MLLRSPLVPASFLGFLVLAPVTVAADPIFSPFLLRSDGGVSTIQFVESDAGFDSVLVLAAPDEQGPFFPNHTSAPGASTSLAFFAAGTELVFGLRVLTTGDSFFTGPASRNPDGVVHARASRWLATPAIPTAGVVVGFEDLLGGGDRDFNDYRFVVSNVSVEDASPVPEPGTLLMFGTGMAALVRRASRHGVKQRRRKPER